MNRIKKVLCIVFFSSISFIQAMEEGQVLISVRFAAQNDHKSRVKKEPRALLQQFDFFNEQLHSSGAEKMVSAPEGLPYSRWKAFKKYIITQNEFHSLPEIRKKIEEKSLFKALWVAYWVRRFGADTLLPSIEQIVERKIYTSGHDYDPSQIDAIASQCDVSARVKSKMLLALSLRQDPLSVSWRVQKLKEYDSSLKYLVGILGDNNIIYRDAQHRIKMMDAESGTTEQISSHDYIPAGIYSACIEEGDGFSLVYEKEQSCAFIYAYKRMTTFDASEYNAGIIKNVLLSPDKRYVAIQCEEAIIIIDPFEPEPLSVIRKYKGFASDIGKLKLVWSPDGRMLFGCPWYEVGRRLSSFGSKEAFIVEVGSPEKWLSLSGNNGFFYLVSWSPDGEKIAMVGYNSILLYDRVRNKSKVLFYKADVNDIKWSDTEKNLGIYYCTGITFLDERAKPLSEMIFSYETIDRHVVERVDWSPYGTACMCRSKNAFVYFTRDNIRLKIASTKTRNVSVKCHKWLEDDSLYVLTHDDLYILDKHGQIQAISLKQFGSRVDSWSWARDHSFFVVNTSEGHVFFEQDGTQRCYVDSKELGLGFFVSLAFSDNNKIIALRYSRGVVLVSDQGEILKQVSYENSAFPLEHSIIWSSGYNCFIVRFFSKIMFLYLDGTHNEVQLSIATSGLLKKTLSGILVDDRENPLVITPHTAEE